jgi:TonB-linked SusC/RagA family outer membrane protein
MTRWRPNIDLILIVLCMFGSAKDAVAQVSDSLKIRVTVLSSETGKPLKDINISFLNSALESGSTDTSGTIGLWLSRAYQEIRLSYPGYHSVTHLLDKKSKDVRILMTPETGRSVFSNVHVPGRTVAGRDLTGASVTLADQYLDKTMVPSFEQNLQGKITGLQVINRSGMPGEGSFMHIRGYNSLYSSSLPLLVIDGMIMRTEGFGNSIINGYHNNPLSDVNLNNISGITVLKDATETAWYGIKGGNGVILINTDQPATGKTTLDVSIAGGVASFDRRIPLMSAGLYRSYLMEQMYDAGMSSEQIFSTYPFMEDNEGYLFHEKYNNNTNWQNQIFRNGMVSEANLKVKGGDERAMYSISGGLLNHNGILNNTSSKRFNFQFNSLVNVSSRIHIGINLRFTNSKFNLSESGSLYQTNPIYAGLIKSPFLAVFEQDQDGIDLPVTEDKDEFGFSNPYVLVHKISATNNGVSFMGYSFLDYKFNEKLSFKITFGINRDKTNERLFIPSWGIAPQGNGSALRSMKSKVDQFNSILNEEYLSYNNTFGSIHHLTVDAGARISSDNTEQQYGLAQNSATDEFRNLNTGKSNEVSFGGYERRSSWVSYFTSIRYKLKDRYMASLFMSMDGSSRFGHEVTDGIQLYGHPFALLPVLGLGWRVTGEPFLKDLSWLNELKLRASYGLSGSDDFPDYAGTSYYVSIPYYSVSGFYKGGIANPRIKWELIRKANAGADIALFGEKLLFSIDVYRDHTFDMVTHIDLPAYYGYNQFLDNSGECINRGIELDLFTRILNRAFKWEVDLNFSRYRNETVTPGQDMVVTEFTGGEKITRHGMPFGLFYGYKSLGVFSSQEQADAANLVDKAGRHFGGGDLHFDDLDGNHIINESDKQIIGNPHPDYFGGIYNKFTYRSISFSAQLSYVIGNDVFNYMRSKTEDMSGFQNQSAAVYKRWVKNGQETSMPRSAYGDPMDNARFSNRWLEDGSFVRLNNLTVSYTYPGKLIFIRDMTIYLTGINLFTWSKYLGYDPEFSYIDSALGQGVDYGKIPQPRSIMMGIKLGL